MKNILIFGASGSGKSTFANALWKKLDTPVYHLDNLSLDTNYNPLPAEITHQKLDAIIEKDTWIIDGLYKRLMYEERLSRADTVIVLDLPLRVSLWRNISRFFRIESGKEERVGWAPGGKNTFSLKFLYWIVWRYPRDVRPKLERDIAKHANITLILLKTEREIHDFLQ